VRLLLRVEDTEPFLDRLEGSFSGTDFRAVLVPVDATHPRLKPEKELQGPTQDAADEKAETKKTPSGR
jgi:hypothetical protein